MGKPNNSLFSKYCLSGIIIFLFCIAANSYAQTLLPVDSVEAENGQLSGVIIDNAVPGYSGSGYVTGFDSSSDKLTVNMTLAEKGYFKIVIRYRSEQRKIQNLILNNGTALRITFPASATFANFDAGSYILHSGENSITVQSVDGGTDIDKITIYSILKRTYNISPGLIDANADSATKALYGFLLSNFGEKIISGQTFDNSIQTSIGKMPMLRGSDFQHYTVGYPYLWNNGFTFGWEDNGNTDSMINWYNSTGKKGIVAFQWHWHSPSGGKVGTNTFYTSSTTFDVSKAVQDGTDENIAIIRDIDSIASQLKKLENAGVPVLWRPLHEASGNGAIDGSQAWFWWGAKGAVVCKKLYDIMYDRITNYHNIHNLIWVWSSPQAAWYPGNDSVDIVGFDSYPAAYNYTIQKSNFDGLYNLTGGEKLITMSENGPIPDPENCILMDAPWSYFMSWGDLVTSQNTPVHINDVYASPYVLTLGYVSSAVLKVSTSRITIEGAGNSTQTFNIFSNMKWSITCDSSWLSFSSVADSGDASITVTALRNTDYTRKATVTVSGIGVTSKKITVTQTVTRTAIKEYSDNFNISVYPNPTKGRFTLSLGNEPAQNAIVNIYNLQGKLLLSKIFRNTSISTIDLSGHPKGIYLAKIWIDGILYNQKICIQ
jgi:mannan endo-1,4-beta-mannosidase